MNHLHAINRLFNARSIAIVGASEDPHKLGSQTLASILRGGYKGTIYPINAKTQQVQGLRTYPSLSAVPDELDLVVVVIPSPAVPGILCEAGEKRAAACVILSAGFRESGRADLEQEIHSIALRYGIRILGPNIQGITYLPNKLCAVFWPVITMSGPLGIISQSGTVTAALSEWAVQEGLGISAAINLGNQVDLCESDILDFLATDQQTRAIALYLEGLKDGRRFLEIMHQVARCKPIVVLKAGQTAGGQRAAASHTGSLAGKWQVFKGACDQFGAVCVDDLQALYDSAKALATMGLPRGKRVLILSTSGGAGLLAAEEAERRGLLIPRSPPEFIEALGPVGLPRNAGLSNPLDLASLDPSVFRQVALMADQFNLADIFLLVFGDPIPGATEVCEYLANHISASVVVGYLGGGEVEKLEREKMHRLGIPVFSSPERAARGIAAATWTAEYRRAHALETN